MYITRLFDILEYCINNHPKIDVLSYKQSGIWKKYSTKDFQTISISLARGLINLGVNDEDKIGIISNNRPEWNFADMATLIVGAINVPIYPTISDNDLQFILKDANIKYFFVSDLNLANKVKRCADAIKLNILIISFENYSGCLFWESLLVLNHDDHSLELLNSTMEKIPESCVATILYTSGTTGNPKGVMLTHSNIISQLKAVKSVMPVDQRHTALSFLPLNHVYERMLFYNYLACGLSIYYAESIDTIASNLLEVKPHIFTTVPRLLEKVYDRIVAKGTELSGFRKVLFFWSLQLGLKYEMNSKNGIWYSLQLFIARKFIFSKWKKALGGNIIAIVSGGAALQEKLARVFWAASIPVLQGYGLTETSPVVSVNYLGTDCNRFGTVGPILNNVQVKIAEDGEILVKGPNVMLGYYNNVQATSEAIIDGWFHTGDIGMLEGKFLRITDRKKEIFKTSGGKYIAPGIIENRLRESPLIEQAMVIGENQKFPSALIILSFNYIRELFKKKSILFSDNYEIINNSQVKELVSNYVNEVNLKLAHYESIKRFELLPKEWTVESGELTPKLSLKRKYILLNNAGIINKIYSIDNH